MRVGRYIFMVVLGLILGVFGAFSWYLQKDSFENFESEKQELLVFETLQNEQGILRNQIISLRRQLEEKQEELKFLGGYRKKVEELETLKEQIGLSESEGIGLEILINDSPLVERAQLDINNESLIHAADIRDIVNILRFSGAKAISVNDQRVLISTPISCVGNNILVNNTHLLPPIQIKAVGDQELMINNLNHAENLNGLKQRIWKNGLKFEVKNVSRTVVPMYNADLVTKYIK